MLNTDFRSNKMLVEGFHEGGVPHFKSILTILLNNQKPATPTTLKEGSGEGLLSVYLNKTFAAFNSLSRSPGDKNV